MRPKVLFATMPGEMVLLALVITAVIGMPFYFLKVRPIQLEGIKAKKEQRDIDMVKEAEQEMKKRREVAKRRDNQQDLTLTTAEKAQRFTPEEL